VFGACALLTLTNSESPVKIINTFFIDFRFGCSNVNKIALNCAKTISNELKLLQRCYKKI
jgi:hypothetical protein